MQPEEKSQTKEVRNQDVICVLGMHRSGTSLLARTLNLMGLYLGSDRALTTEPALYNATGHWEHVEITNICNAILKRHRGSWDDPPRFPQGWPTSAAIDDLRNQAQRLIEDQFGEVEQWGWKDPRTPLTLPFWQQLLPRMRYIICLRNPLDVALSLANRDCFSAEKSSFLWFTYVCLALKHTEGKPRLIVFYEDLMDDSLRELQRLAEFLGDPERAKQVGVHEAVSGFIEKGLQHYRTSLLRPSVRSRMDLYARALYIAQRMSVSFDRGLDDQIYETLSTLSRYSFEAWRTNRKETLKRHLVEHDEMLSKRLAEIAEAIQSKSSPAEQMVHELSTQLLYIQTQLPRVRDTLSRRLRTRYKHSKDYLLPIYREFGEVLRQRMRSKPPHNSDRRDLQVSASNHFVEPK